MFSLARQSRKASQAGDSKSEVTQGDAGRSVVKSMSTTTTSIPTAHNMLNEMCLFYSVAVAAVMRFKNEKHISSEDRNLRHLDNHVR